jgi:chromosome segregation ATPase
MADQNQDLPLVVSEILIEMHELRGDIKELQKVTVHLSQSVTKLETSVDRLQVEMHEVKGAIVQLAGSIKTLAEERHIRKCSLRLFGKKACMYVSCCNSTMLALPNWKTTSPTNKQQTLWAASY